MDEPIIFQATKKYRLQYAFVWFVALPLLLFFATLILIQDYGWLAKILFLTIIGILLFVSILFTWRSPKKIKLSLSMDNMQGSIENQSFQIPFSSVMPLCFFYFLLCFV